MSAARDFLADLDRAGIQIVPIGDGLRLRSAAGKPVPPDLVSRARTLKPALLEMLGEPSSQDVHTVTATDNLSVAAFDADAEKAEERSAIAEHEGGLQRVEADFLGAASVAPLMTGETVADRERVVIHFADHFDRMRRRRMVSPSNGGDAA